MSAMHRERLSALGRRLATLLFGDRLGLALFLGSLACFGAWWRIGFFITDSTTVANALVNVGNGRLAVVETPYSLTLGSQPGLVRVGDQAFGRNYGHVLLALPALWLLEAATAVTDLTLFLAGLWSLVLVAFAGQVATLTHRDGVATVGSAVALVLFAGNALTARSLSGGDQPWAAVSTAQSGPPLELVALQVTTMLAAALLATTMYRLLARFHGRRVGLAAGVGLAVATPIGFWASIPKRHVLTATAIVVVLYWFAVSRERRDRRGLLARAGAYATLGLLTTIHPFEALFLLLVLAPIDVLTAPANDSRSLVLVGIVFLLSLVPFVLLNTLISGNPIRPPRMLSGVSPTTDLQPGLEPDAPGDGAGGASGGGADTGSNGGTGTEDGTGNSGGTDTGGETSDGGGSDGGDNTGGATSDGESGDGGTGDGTGSDGGTSGGGGGVSIPLDVVLGPVTRGVGYQNRVVGFAMGAVVDGFHALGESDRLYHTFVRSGRIPGINYAVNDFETVELALLEAFPLAAALLWLPTAGIRHARESIDRSGFGGATHQTDLLAAAFALVFVAVYMPRLPLQSMVTLRYILPVMPLLLYGLARLAVVRRPVEAVPRWLAGAYAATVVGGGVLVVAALSVLDPAVGEAVQFHALLGLASGAVAAVCVLTWGLHDSDRLLAVALALPAGATTVFLILSSLAYFDYGRYALGLTRALAGLLPVV